MNCNTNANFSIPNKLSSCPVKVHFSQVLAHCALTLLIQKRWLFYEAILFGISWPSDRWVDRILGFVTRASLIETSHFVEAHAWYCLTYYNGHHGVPSKSHDIWKCAHNTTLSARYDDDLFSLSSTTQGLVNQLWVVLVRYVLVQYYTANSQWGKKMSIFGSNIFKN